MNASPQLSVAIITRDRADELAGVLDSIATQDCQDFEILVADNGSLAENLQIIREIAARHPKVRLIELGSNLGVAGGRNAILAVCRGDLILEIDDDALLGHASVLSHAVGQMRRMPDVGILAFKIVNFHTGAIDRHEYPFLTKKRDPDAPGDTTWFIGCGHVIRRELIARIGAYHDFFPYGAEELDYAFRALDAGYRIFYDPRLLVLHKKSLKHRIVDPVEFGALSLKQRLKVALLNLPWPMCLTYFLVRGFLYSRRLRHPTVISRALRMLWADRQYLMTHRRRIQWGTAWQILKLKGPLLF